MARRREPFRRPELPGSCVDRSDAASEPAPRTQRFASEGLQIFAHEGAAQMNSLIYLVGLVVVVLAILSLLGLA
jgi:hypothetical protein